MNDKTNIYPSKWKSAQHGKCPRCRTGDMFNGSTYNIFNNGMKKDCPHCNLRFEKEPGYFYVAMFVSYVFVVAELVTACVATFILTGNDSSPWLYVVICFVVVILLAPFNGRYSRVAMLYSLTPSFGFNPKYFGGNIKQLDFSLSTDAGNKDIEMRDIG